MKVGRLAPFADVLLIEPRVFGDARGFFFESFSARVLAEHGLDTAFVQDNHSRSNKGVLRGLHFQRGAAAQGKLVRVSRGAVYDVVVDLRQSSPTFGQSAGHLLSEINHNQLYVPPGYGHGFLVLEDGTDFLYKTTQFYAPESEAAVHWNDPALRIQWPLAALGLTEPLVSAKDAQALSLGQAQQAGLLFD
ncbi:MAG: dTDP-4-dehydrorhamnose 3,5-epimerase [Betaproteobacteria bacterium]|nr:dTDP-4-dehydrorhamnose 3,5-epimerase [Betaproteobacteria bacterium]